MNRIRLFFWTILLPLINSYAFPDYDMTLLTMQNGLSDNTVTCIYKDADNFMWFGTDNGLNRYDGKTIRNFSNSSSHMRISEIKEISDSYLAILSDGKLQCFDRKRECFIPISHTSDHSAVQISHLLTDSSSQIWGITGKRMILYQYQEIKNRENEVTEIQLSVLRQKEFFLNNDQEALADFCYIGSLKKAGLITNRGRLILIPLHSLETDEIINLTDDLSFLEITSVYTDKYSLWVTTIAKGIYRIHFPNREIEHITYQDNPEKQQLSHTDVYQITPINETQYIAATWSGYTLLTCDKDTHRICKTNIYKTLSHTYRNIETRMLSAYYDRHHQLWLGTNGGGVIHMDLQTQPYRQFYQKRHNEICGITIDNEQYIWLATYHQGIMKSITPFNDYSVPDFHPTGPDDVRSKKTVLCTVKEANGTLWFGNHDGTITSYHPDTRKFQIHTIEDGENNLNSPVWALFIDSMQRMWVGTEKGLFLYTLQTGKFRRLHIEESLKNEITKGLLIRAITGMANGDIWLGTSNAGICRVILSPDGNISSVRNGYEADAKIAPQSVRSLAASSDGNLYIGYMDGFAVLTPDSDRISNFYTTYNGLPNNYIGAITEDEKGRIWLGSNSGISLYNRNQHLFYNYYFTGSNRSVLSYKNLLLWGNNRSLIYFEPDNLSRSTTNEQVLITGIEVENRTVPINKQIHGQIILKRSITYTDSLVLNYTNREFTLTFNNLSYIPELQKYTYHLLPVQEEWLVAEEDAKATYSNLPEGDYLFEVKSIFPDGHSGKATSLKIKILPHWSHTPLFRLSILLGLIGLSAYGFRLLLKRKKRKEEEMRIKQELLTVNEQHERLKHIYNATLMTKEETADEEKNNPFMQQVIHVIETNIPDENFNVKALAKELNMSQPTLYRRMKQCSELTVIDLIQSVRINKAAALLMENRYSIQEISAMVGYSDARTLRKHFTEQFGIPPSKYAEKKQNAKTDYLL